MLVSLAFTKADLAVAEGLKTFLETQSFQVSLADESTWTQPYTGEAVVALWSKETPFSPDRLAYEKLALNAWADNRLVFVKLDPHFAPVGLRDLPSIDATFETQRELVAWRSIAKRLREMQRPVPPAPQPSPMVAKMDEPPRELAPLPKKASGGAGFAWLAVLVLIGGLLWLGSFSPVKGSPVAGVPVSTVAFGLAGLVVAILFLKLLVRPKRRRPSISAPAAAAESSGPAPSIFDDLVKSGQRLWVDTQEIGAGESWAGEIVRGIKTVRGVAVMCSKAAFESDHVKREVYLADRYKRRIVPVFLDDAPVPEDFEYFFAGVQWLKLKDLPPADRGKAVAKALS
jgi:hypothetical protein